ncbi:MAG: GAF domain-containing sensor histidine kinase [Burkholderiales bacterium]
MLTPLFPANEAARLAALRALKILDTPAEQRFDRITAFAKDLFQLPIALVSLVDQDRQWFKSRAGLDASETPRSVSFCGHAILAAEVFVIEDATIDERFRDNPLVTGAPFVRFYAGVPLNAGGHRVGTLCLIGHQPRHFGERDRGLLKGLAAWVERELTILGELQTMAIRLESQARLEAVLNGIADSVITNIPGGEIQTVNRAAGEMFRCEPESLIGKNIRDLVPERDRVAQDEYTNYLEQLPDPLVRAGMEATGLRSDGSEFPAEISFSRINLDGRRIYSGILRDVSERKRIDTMKSEFISTVSHELRTPLTSIRGALGLVTGGVVGEIPEKARVMIDIAHANSERLVRLINDILDIEKIEAGKIALELRPVELQSLLERAVADNAGFAAEHKVRFEIRGSIPQVHVHVDHDRMLQVLSNLLSNAAKFSPPDETVLVSAALIDGRARISVQDRGPGIPAEFRGRIFGKFAQADSSDTRKKGGTGLGLSITKAIVESHGGTIGFDAAADRGTVFRFDLPVRSA